MTQVDEVLYYRLVNVDVPKELAVKHVKMLTSSGGYNTNSIMPYTALLYEYLSAVENSGLSLAEKEVLSELVFKEALRVKEIVATEIKQLVLTANSELQSLKSHPRLERYRAAQILHALNQAVLLGFDYEGLHQARSICLSKMGLNVEARAAEQKETKTRFKQNTRQTLDRYGRKLAGKLRGLFKLER
jgi:hypothetical protein